MKRQWAPPETQEGLSDHKETLFSLWEWLSTGTDCPRSCGVSFHKCLDWHFSSISPAFPLVVVHQVHLPWRAASHTVEFLMLFACTWKRNSRAGELSGCINPEPCGSLHLLRLVMQERKRVKPFRNGLQNNPNIPKQAEFCLSPGYF